MSRNRTICSIRVDALFARDELPLGRHDQGDDAKTGSAERDHIIVARQHFERHARVAVGGVPVIAEAALLDHVEQGVVVETLRRRGGRLSERRLAILAIDGSDFVRIRLVRRTDKVDETLEIARAACRSA